jgi:hypothetical protein
MIANNTSIHHVKYLFNSQLFQRIGDQFDKLKKRGAFMDQYKK